MASPVPQPRRKWALAAFLAIVAAGMVIVAALTLVPVGRGACRCPVLSSCHCPVGSLSVAVDGSFLDVAQPTYPTCNATADSGCFAHVPYAGSTACDFDVNTASTVPGDPQEAIVVTATEAGGTPATGVVVSLTGQTITLQHGPSWNATTGSTPGLGAGQAAFPYVSGVVPSGDLSGGAILATATLSSGGVLETMSASIPVTPPSALAC